MLPGAVRDHPDKNIDRDLVHPPLRRQPVPDLRHHVLREVQLGQPQDADEPVGRVHLPRHDQVDISLPGFRHRQVDIFCRFNSLAI